VPGRTADAVVADLHQQPGSILGLAPGGLVVVQARPHRRGGGVGVLGEVGQRLADHEVRRCLDRPWQPPGRDLDQRDRHRGAGGERGERRAEAFVGQDRRVDPAGQLAQLADRQAQLLRRAAQRLHQTGVRGGAERCELPPGGVQRQRQGQQALLRAVVEVALDPPAFLVAGLHDPGP
jgi:hypothetical protein